MLSQCIADFEGRPVRAITRRSPVLTAAMSTMANSAQDVSSQDQITPPMDWSYDESYSLLPWNHEDERSSLAPIPSREEMDQRWTFRKTIHEQTLHHRRIHNHGGMGDTGGNILWSLMDRERRGARKSIILEPRRTWSQRMRRPHESDLNDADVGEQQCLPKKGRGENYPMTIFHEIRTFAEYYSVVRYHSSYFHHLGGTNILNTAENGAQRSNSTASSPAVSTISIAFSPDAKTMASTHGDHTVKITCCSTGRLIQTLDGHPRTPWTVKYHPIDSRIVASGCLGFQVRVWNWTEKTCLQMIRLNHAIISLSFHPTGHILAVASGSRLHFWDYNNHGGLVRTGDDGRPVRSARGALTEVEQRHMLRCVHFPPDGDTVIVGGMNPTQDDPRNPPGPGRGGMSQGGMSFYLRLWDFSIDAALHPYAPSERERNTANSIGRGGRGVQRKVLSNPRTFVPRALLYNDGGFDVSPDGKTLCACAEYWLPEGINSAIELLEQEEERYEKKSMEDEIEVENSHRESNEEGQPQDVDMSSPESLTPLVEEEKMNAPNPAPTPPANPNRSNVEESFESPPRDRSTGISSQSNVQPGTNPVTPPNPNRLQIPLSPPSPPGRRWAGGLGQRRPAPDATQPAFNGSANPSENRSSNGQITSIPPPPHHQHMLPTRPPHPLSVVSDRSSYPDLANRPGRYVPHVVTVSLDTTPLTSINGLPQGRVSVAKGHSPRLGQLLEACPLDGTKASGVTCVKFSPSADFCLLGYGVREPQSSIDGEDQLHPVTALYRVRGGMTHVSTMLSGDDDVNIARFHPDSGYGFVYGTKQGRVRVLSARPWNYYD